MIPLHRILFSVALVVIALGGFFLASDEPTTKGAIKGLDTATTGLVLLPIGLLVLAFSNWLGQKR